MLPRRHHRRHHRRRHRSPAARLAFASALFASSLVCAPRVARAQRLVAAPETAVPFSFDLPHGPLEEPGALVAWGSDVVTRADRTLRVTPSGVTAEPGITDAGAADVSACAGSRWVVRIASRPRWSVTRAGASSAVWSSDAVTDVVVRCVAGQVLVGGVANGELVTRVVAPAVGAERRVRIAPRGVYPTIHWVAAAVDELFATVHDPRTGAVELLRLSGSAVTHRRALGRATDVALALGANRVLVGATPQDLLRLDLATFARSDLAPGPRATLPFAGGVQLLGLWPGPRDRVVVATRSNLPGIGAPPEHYPVHPPAYSPAHVPTTELRLWVPPASAVGPEVLVRADTSAAGWLGEQFVVIAGAQTAVTPRGSVVEHDGRVLRFTVAP